MNRLCPIFLVWAATACGGGDPRPAAAADDTPAQARSPEACSLVTEAEVAQVAGRAPEQLARDSRNVCKAHFGGDTRIEVWVTLVGPPFASADELTKDLNDDAMSGDGWKALPAFPVPASGNEDLGIVIAKKGILKLQLTGFSVPYKQVEALAAIAAKRLE